MEKTYSVYQEMERFYENMRKLPSKSGDLDLLVSNAYSGEKGESFYNLFSAENKYNGIFGRIRLWKEKILPYFFNLPIMDLVKSGDLEMKVTNNFFRSRIVVTDTKTKQNVFKMKAPWLSSALSYLWGQFTKSRFYMPIFKSDEESNEEDEETYQQAA
jgi:hypothetical protein